MSAIPVKVTPKAAMRAAVWLCHDSASQRGSPAGLSKAPTQPLAASRQ